MNDTTTPESGRDGSAGPFANLGQAPMMSPPQMSAEPPPQASDVGTLLCATRMRLGKDLQDVAAVLHIRYNFLVAIEDGRYEDLPGQAYAIGFVRAYADHLGLDGDEVVRRYKEETAGIKRVTRYEYPIPPPESGIPSGALLLIAVVLGMMVYGVWYTMADADRRAADVIQEVPDRLAAMLRDDTATTPDPDGTPQAQDQTAEEQVADAGVAEEPPPPPEDDQTVSAAPDPGTPAPAVVASAPSAPVVAKPDVAPPERVKSEPVTAAPASAPMPSAPAVTATMPPAGTAPVAATTSKPSAPITTAQAPVPDTAKVDAPKPDAAPASKIETAKPEPAKTLPAATQVASAPPPVTASAPKPEAAKPEPTKPEPVKPEAAKLEAVTSDVAKPEAPKPEAAKTSAPATPSAVVPSPAPSQTAAVPSTTTTAKAPAKTAPTTGKNGSVELRAKSDSWIQVRDGEQLLLTRFLRKGESYKVPERSGLTLMTLNAGGVEVIVDGAVMPPLGEQGSVARGVSLDADKLKAQPKAAAVPAPTPAPANN